MITKNQTTRTLTAVDTRRGGATTTPSPVGRLRAALAGLLLTGAVATAQALPPEHEVQRLMLAVEEAVSAERWTEAADYLNRLQRLEEARPAEYYFYRGRVMAQSGHYNEARAALETYIAGTGADGDHYTEALKLITRIERSRGDRNGGRNGGEPVAEIRPATEQQSLAQLQRQYQVSTDREALVAHLNGRLSAAGWRREARLIRVGEPADVEYRVSAANGEIQIRESRAEQDGSRRLQAHVIRVYGISPAVNWDCESATGSCWVYDPRDGSRLLQLTNDRQAAADIASTLGRLIRNLQQPAGRS